MYREASTCAVAMAWGSISKYPSLLVLHDARHAQDKTKAMIREFI
jgi:hypothetical protein